MAVEARYWFVRHTQTPYNVTKLLTGQMNPDISEVGYLQAQTVANKLKEQEFDLILTSDLRRCVVLSEIINSVRENKIPVVESAALREFHLGIYQNTPASLFGKVVDNFIEHPDWEIPGGESVNQMLQRGREFLDEYYNKFPNFRMLILSHSTFIKAMLSSALNMDVLGVVKKYHINNSGFIPVIYKGQGNIEITDMTDLIIKDKSTV